MFYDLFKPSSDLGYHVVFVMGKGGVGKTTISSALAYRLALKGYRVLIVSLDPAHNLGDVLDTELVDEPRRIVENLWASEVDFDAMVNRYLRELSEKMKYFYKYLTVLNLDKYIDVLRESPGIEEYATLEKILDILKDNSRSRRYDIIVFDTPPTGLTVRIMALPTITLLWINRLMQLRLAILDRRRIIARITGEPVKVRIGSETITLPYDPHDDPVFRELESYRNDIEWVNNIFTSKDYSSIVMVVNPEMLPVFEAEKALKTLRKYGIEMKALVVNKVLPPESIGKGYEERLKLQEEVLKLVSEKFTGITIRKVPLLPSEPRGLKALEKVASLLE